MGIRAAVRRSIVLAALGAVAAPVTVAIAPPAAQAYNPSDRYFDREEIEQLTAPIALYPDPLLAQILVAAAYPEEIAAAQRYMERRSDWSGIDGQDWDYSVRAIARYPEVLHQLAGDLDWTEALGIAHINQPDEVADAIQRWRLQAYELGNLRSGSQQTIFADGGYVRIVPAEQDYFYIPQYDPRVIYVDRYVSGYSPFIFFGPRYSYGSWFDRDWDWRQRRICYTDRSYWRGGRPVFHPQFDRVHVDRNRPWQPDRRRFKPPQKPKMPPHFVRGRIPPPPPEVKPGMRHDERPRQVRPDDRDEDRRPAVRRGSGDERPPATRRDRDDDDTPQIKRTPQPQVTPPPRPAQPPPRIDQPRRTETPRVTPPSHTKQPPRIEQPARTAPPARIEQPRRVEQPQTAPKRVEQPRPQVQPSPPPQRQRPPPPPPREEEQQPMRGLRR